MALSLSGWALAVPPASCATPADLPAGLDWLAIDGPCTVAAALQQAGRLDPESPEDLGSREYWYRCTVELDRAADLRFEGLAGMVELWLDDRCLAQHDHMYLPLECRLQAQSPGVLYLCVRVLENQAPRRQGRARWRPRMIQPPRLRDVRQSLLGRMSGWCPDLPPLGPFRAVSLRPADAVAEPRLLALQTDWNGQGAELRVQLQLPDPDGGWLYCAGHRLPLQACGEGVWEAAGPVPGAQAWWPHTHGRPELHRLELETAAGRRVLARVGFRRITLETADGAFAWRINGLPVFCRGACWTPSDLAGLSCEPLPVRAQIGLLAEAGMNMVRLGGTMLYEDAAFFEACDEAGVLVWQDFMFANFDYPGRDAAFMAQVEAEARHQLQRSLVHPSLALLCGGSEVRQQAEMLGVDWPADEPLFEGLLAGIAAQLRPDLPYLPNTPWGGTPAFSTGQGVSHYYGVGAYMRPLEDARRAGVRFASECMALAHLPSEAELPPALARQPLDVAWKRGTPRDLGASWDFDDVRDHYLGSLYGLDPARLRREDPARYLDLGRAVSCDLAEALFSEWRRPGSGCGGGLVWQWRDLRQGAGWGLLDQAGVAKPVLHALGRLLQPVQLLLTDEGLDGLALHLINESGQPLALSLGLRALREGERSVAEGERMLTLAPREQRTVRSGDLLGRFFDITYAYRFGPPAHDVSVATLRDAHSGALLAQACHLPQRLLPRVELGLQARVSHDAEGVCLHLSTRRFAQYLHFSSQTHRPAQDWFHLAPGEERCLRLSPRPGKAQVPALQGGSLAAINGLGSTWVALAEPPP